LILLQNKVIRYLTSAAEDNKLIASIILNMLLFSFFFLFFTPKFESNDDVSMMSIASGYFLEEPNEFLIFINIIIGKLMKYLYTIMPIYNWYVILFYSLQFFSMVVIFYVVLKHRGVVYNYLLYIAFFIFMVIPFLALLQFTTTAFLAGSSGMLLLISLNDGSQSNRSWIPVSAGIFLVVVSGLLRVNILFLVLLLFAPFLMSIIIKTRSVLNIIPIIIAAALFLGAVYYNNISYYNENAHWRYYQDYNALRAQLTDYPYYAWDENTSKIYEDVGWSENDVAMFRSWSFADEDIFSLEDLTYIVSNISPSRGVNETLITFNKSMSYIGRTRLLFAGAFFIFALSFTRREEKLILIATVLMAIAASMYFSYYGRLPFRIIFPLVYTVGLVSLYYLTMCHNIIIYKVKILSSQKAFLFAISAIYIISVIPFFAINARSSASNKDRQDEMNIILYELSSQEYIYARWAGVLNTQPIPTFYTNSGRDLKQFAVGGWIVPSPHHRVILAKYSIENVYYALLRENVLLIARPEVLGLLERFMNENYGLNIKIEPALDVKSTTAYRVIKVD
jgi:hypothetical protein